MEKTKALRLPLVPHPNGVIFALAAASLSLFLVGVNLGEHTSERRIIVELVLVLPSLFYGVAGMLKLER